MGYDGIYLREHEIWLIWTQVCQVMKKKFSIESCTDDKNTNGMFTSVIRLRVYQIINVIRVKFSEKEGILDTQTTPIYNVMVKNTCLKV